MSKAPIELELGVGLQFRNFKNLEFLLEFSGVRIDVTIHPTRGVDVIIVFTMMTSNSTHLPKELLLRIVLTFVGPKLYLPIALSSKCLRAEYKGLFESSVTRMLELFTSFPLAQLAFQEMRCNKESQQLFRRHACPSAGYHGNIEILEWLVTNGSCLNEEVAKMIAAGGHLNCLEWARAKGCPWNSEVCSYSALTGHLEVLQWARANGCPWDKDVCKYSALNGQLEVLQWARANGCPWNDSICFDAAGCGHLEVLQWARANGCPWDKDLVYACAEYAKHLDVMEWIRAA